MSSQDPKLTNTYFEDHFSLLKEPRRASKGNFVYPLERNSFLTISDVISGCNTWVSIANFGKLKREWLQKIYPYKNKTPSHDAISDLFAILDSEKFGECFSNWVSSIAKSKESDIVAFDGKPFEEQFFRLKKAGFTKVIEHFLNEHNDDSGLYGQTLAKIGLSFHKFNYLLW